MRKLVYGFLLRTPIRLASGAATAIGAVGSLFPDWTKQKAGAYMSAEQIHTISISLLVAAAIYFFLLWWLKPGEEDGPASSQTTSGHHSPAIGNITGPVNFYPPPAAVQERKSPYGSGGPPGREMTAEVAAVLARAARAKRPMPDVNLTFVLMRVYAFLRKKHESQAVNPGEVDKTIADTVHLHELHVWGRIGERPISLIPLDRWSEGLLKHRDKKFVWVGPFSAVEYSDLQFNRSEVDRFWPEPPPSTTNDGKP